MTLHLAKLCSKSQLEEKESYQDVDPSAVKSVFQFVSFNLRL